MGRSNKQNRPWRRKRKRTNRAVGRLVGWPHTHTCIGCTWWLWLCCRVQQHVPVWREIVGCVTGLACGGRKGSGADRGGGCSWNGLACLRCEGGWRWAEVLGRLGTQIPTPFWDPIHSKSISQSSVDLESWTLQGQCKGQCNTHMLVQPSGQAHIIRLMRTKKAKAKISEPGMRVQSPDNGTIRS